MSSFFDSSNLIKLIVKWKIHIAIVTVVVIALSVFFSSPIFIKPKYKSFAVVYPSNLIPYSSETPTEQMLQLLKSDDINFELIQKFHLSKHYGIDTTDSKYLSRLQSEYTDNVNIRRTEFESIIIEVYDTDPIVACEMVKEIINMLNAKARNLQREKTSEVVAIYAQQLAFKQHQIDSIQGTLMKLRKENNIYDYSIQLKEYTRGYLNSVNAGKGANQPVYTEMFNNLNEHGGEYLFLGGYLASLAGSYNDIKIEYDQALSDLTKQLTYTNIVTSPYPADNKSYPIRWLVVLVSTLSSLLLLMIIISIIEKSREHKKKLEAVSQ
jgi:capsular polysaccharide biosynthesis protein